MSDNKQALQKILAQRDRNNMQPTIDALMLILAENPDDAEVIYQVGGAFDTDGQEKEAVKYYEKALNIGLSEDYLKECYLGYGSTLKNLGRLNESSAVFQKAISEFPDFVPLKIFQIFTLHALNKKNQALSNAIKILMENTQTEEILQYEPAIIEYSDEIEKLDE